MPTRPKGTRDALGRRALNRALLDRQMLLRRRRFPVLDAVERLVAMQAQVPRDPYVALWSRLDRFRPDALATPIAERRAVRMTLLRGTLHAVTARDALALRPSIQPVAEHIVGQTPFRRAADGIDVDELVAFLRALLDERPRQRPELVRAIGERWPDRDASSLAFALYLVPTIQVTPRGLWGQTGRSTCTTVEHWLGRPIERTGEPDDMILRYLTTFGPAAVADAQTWSGLSGLKEVFDRLRPRLRTFRDEQGRELFDVPSAPLPDPDTRSRSASCPSTTTCSSVTRTAAGSSRPTCPSGPRWAGAPCSSTASRRRGRMNQENDMATLRIEPFRKLPRADRTAVTEEGERLLAFLTDGGGSRDVRFFERD